MVDTIRAAVSGASFEVRPRQVVALHGIFMLAGAILVASTLVGLRALTLTVDAWARYGRWPILLLSLAWATRSLSTFGLPYPRSRWQVPERWRSFYPVEVTMAMYGFLLGVGLLTDVVGPAYWILVLVSLWMPGPAAILFPVWGIYAITRFSFTLHWLRTSTNDSLSCEYLPHRREMLLVQAFVVCLVGLLAVL